MSQNKPQAIEKPTINPKGIDVSQMSASQAASATANREVKSISNGPPGILTDKEILKAVKDGELIIEPFNEKLLQPVGYECTLYGEMGIPNTSAYGIIDTHNLIGDQFRKVKLPNRMQKNLAHLFSLNEKLQLPNNIYAVFVPKSTWARLGMVMNTAIVDPGFKGTFSFTISSMIHIWAGFYPRQPIGVLQFYRLPSSPDKPYSGKYQKSQYLQQAKFD